MSKNKKNNGGNNNSNREAEARERARQEADGRERARRAVEAAAAAARTRQQQEDRQRQNTQSSNRSNQVSRPTSRVVTAAIESTGGKLNKSDVQRLQEEGLTSNQIEKVAAQVGSIGAGAQKALDRLRTGGGSGGTGGTSESGSSGGSRNNGNPIGGGADPNRNPANAAAFTTTYGFSGDAMQLGMSGDFAKGLILPGKNAQLTAAEQEDVRRNIENQFRLYADQQLTSLRGRISKELAQLYNMTEIGKSKIAAQSAMDTTRETGMQTFRQNVRDNYGRSLMSMW
jgi:hypothetical protein